MPPKRLGIEDETGSIEVGKAADLVLWNRNPFSVYALADVVWIDGYAHYDRKAHSACRCGTLIWSRPWRGSSNPPGRRHRDPGAF